MAKPSHDRAENIYRQILELVEELWIASSDTSDSDDEEDDGANVGGERDLVDEMVEEAAARGLDEESAEKVFKAVAALAKKAEEA